MKVLIFWMDGTLEAFAVLAVEHIRGLSLIVMLIDCFVQIQPGAVICHRQSNGRKSTVLREHPLLYLPGAQ